MTQTRKCKKGTCIYCSECPKCACKCHNKRKRTTRSNNSFYREESSSYDEGIASATRSSVVAKQKKGQETDLNANCGVPQPFFTSMISLFEENPNIRPRDAWKRFQEMNPPAEALSASYPTEQQVQSKISSMKVKRKKQN